MTDADTLDAFMQEVAQRAEYLLDAVGTVETTCFVETDNDSWPARPPSDDLFAIVHWMHQLFERDRSLLHFGYVAMGEDGS